MLISALKHDRRAIGIDLEERFCEVAAQAIEQWSGQLAMAV